jgi:hypothetical protein
MHRELVPLMYETITVSVDDKNLLKIDWPSAKTRLLENGSKDVFNCLQFTRNLLLAAPIVHRVLFRCYNGLYPGAFDFNGSVNRSYNENKNRSTHDKSMKRLAKKFRNIRANVARDSLRSFSCVHCYPSNDNMLS